MEINPQKNRVFTQSLMRWHEQHNDRSLPWKNEKDPYKIWLSEIILQQTRAQQGLPYYLKFIEAFPTVKKLAAADDEVVFRLWQGLGYYNRCRNMLATARIIVKDHKAKFPADYEAILSLKGIGPYTAAAIASFAFGLPHAVVDGNVYRVLARYFGIELASDSTEGKKVFQQLADELLHADNSAAYNQAIMDLGATVCTPANPACDECPLQKNCFAYEQDMIADLPVKNKKVKVKQRFFNYIIFRNGDSIWIHKRSGKDIWGDLYQPFLIETQESVDVTELAKTDELHYIKGAAKKLEFLGTVSQRLTHQLIETNFYMVSLSAKSEMPDTSGVWVKMTELDNYAFPKTVVSFFEKKLYF